MYKITLLPCRLKVMDIASKPVVIPRCLTLIDHHPIAKITDKIPSIHAISPEVYDLETVFLKAWRADLDNSLMPRDRYSRWTKEAWNRWQEAMRAEQAEESESKA